MSGYAKVYISMPHQFLADLDRTAQEEHLSRSVLIREAIKVYMASRRKKSQSRFFEMTRSLRESFDGLPEHEVEALIDRAVSRVRSGNDE